MADIPHDNKSQLDRIQAGLIEGEQIHAVYDLKGRGTGYIGLTDRRLIVQDESVIGSNSSLVSIPYSKINMVGTSSEGWLRSTSELTVVASGGARMELEFRGEDRAFHAYQVIISNIT